jgi:hypothetical protein
VARAGYDVAIHHRSAGQDAKTLADEITAMGRKADGFVADLSQEDEAQGLIPAVAARMGTVSVATRAPPLGSTAISLDAPMGGSPHAPPTRNGARCKRVAAAGLVRGRICSRGSVLLRGSAAQRSASGQC